MPYTVTTSSESSTHAGPRVSFGNDQNYQAYLVVGAFGNVNHIDNIGGRPLVITGLPNAPAGANLAHLVIDTSTGQIYLAP